jgi:hypothetical protein
MLPKGGRGFVDPQTGKTNLKRVLCALDPNRDPRTALAFLKQWLPVFGGAGMEILVLQTCNPDESTEMILPQTADISWRQEARPGDPVATIVAAAREMEAEMVVVTTRGRLGLIKRMRGSFTDLILRDLRLPLLSVPAL